MASGNSDLASYSSNKQSGGVVQPQARGELVIGAEEFQFLTGTERIFFGNALFEPLT